MSGDAPYHERQRLQLCAVHAANAVIGHEAFSKADFDAIAKDAAAELAQVEEGSSSGWLTPNPHKSPLGLGNYDENVLARALKSKGLDLGQVHGEDNACGLVPKDPLTRVLALEIMSCGIGIRLEGAQALVPVHWVIEPKPGNDKEVRIISAGSALGAIVKLQDGSSFENPLNIWMHDALAFVANTWSRSIWGKLFGGRHWFTIKRDSTGQWWNLDSKLSQPKPLAEDDAFRILSSVQDLRVVRKIKAED